MQRIIVAILGVFCVLTLALAAPPAGLKAYLDGRRADPSMRGACLGIFVQSLEDGEIWYDGGAHQLLIPASNAKIATAALALGYLKPEYHFTTRLLTSGARNGEVLDGDLYVQGGGDPSLTPADLQTMARLLAAGDQERGIPPLRTITGKLILDASFFPGNAPLLGNGWEKDDLLWYYAAPSSALSCNRNAVKITVTGTTHQKRAAITVDPPTTVFTVNNRTLTNKRLRTGAIQVKRSGSVLHITGNLAPGATLTERISIPDPPRFLADQFRQALQQCGVRVGEVQFGTADLGQMTILVEHNSAPLGELMATMLKDSDNHYAEQYYWTLLSLYSLEKPLEERYMAMLQDYFAHSGMMLWGMKLVDGSGLSRLNRLSPAAVGRLLAYMATTPHFTQFYQALPIAGEDGTMQKRLCMAPCQGNVRAKTGTMRAVSSLSGYVTTAGGERLVFSMMMNGYRGGAPVARKLQDEIVNYLACLQE